MISEVSLAAAAVRWFGPPDEAVVGDFVERVAAGVSRSRMWLEVASIVAFGAWRQTRRNPLRALLAIVAGWAALLLMFSFGDMAADGLAKLLWNWDGAAAYAGTTSWWPFHVSAVVVSYAGFALSAAFVSRVFQRTHALLLVYVMSTFAALMIATVIIEVLSRTQGAVPVPHPLFYLVSVTLPYQWRSGVALVPIVMLGAGIAASVSRSTGPGTSSAAPNWSRDQLGPRTTDQGS